MGSLKIRVEKHLKLGHFKISLRRLKLDTSDKKLLRVLVVSCRVTFKIDWKIRDGKYKYSGGG